MNFWKWLLIFSWAFFFVALTYEDADHFVLIKQYKALKKECGKL
jgi:hypothetical protein